MTIIRTVLGDIAPDQLGVTAAHEHLYCNQYLCREPAFPRRGERMRLTDVDLVVSEAGDFHAAGGRAIIEVTCHGWGRDLGVLAEISRRTGLHVVATSGFYVENCLPDFAHDATVDALADVLVDEVTIGVAGTTARTGVLKAAVSRPKLEGVEERCTRAVAQAQLRTGAAITTHTSGSARFQIEGGNAGDQFLDLFEAEGVDLTRVIIGHCDENVDIRQLMRLMDRGAYVEFDVIGKEHWLLDETRADVLAALIERGYQDRLLLSSDRNRMSELKVSGGKGYDHVLRNFIPLLRERGVDQAAIDALLVGNPSTVFTVPLPR